MWKKFDEGEVGGAKNQIYMMFRVWGLGFVKNVQINSISM